MDECTSDPCEDGEMCINAIGSYICVPEIDSIDEATTTVTTEFSSPTTTVLVQTSPITTILTSTAHNRPEQMTQVSAMTTSNPIPTPVDTQTHPVLPLTATQKPSTTITLTTITAPGIQWTPGTTSASDNEHSKIPDQFNSTYDGCIWPQNAITKDRFVHFQFDTSSFDASQIQRRVAFRTNSIVKRFCPTKCTWDNEECTGWNLESKYVCIQRVYQNKKFNFWTKSPDQYRTRDVFYGGSNHDMKRKFGLSQMCSPEMTILDKFTVCGLLPQIPHRYMSTSRWNENRTSINCKGEKFNIKSKKLNLECGQRRKWIKPQWVHISVNGRMQKVSSKIRPKCKSIICSIQIKVIIFSFM